jgi:hypothetical protein
MIIAVTAALMTWAQVAPTTATPAVGQFSKIVLQVAAQFFVSRR